MPGRGKYNSQRKRKINKELRVYLALFIGDGGMAVKSVTACSSTIHSVLEKYVEEIKQIYGEFLKTVILYGSYARGDFGPDSDIDIMILVDMSDMEIKEFRHELSRITYDFNEYYGIDIKPIAKSNTHFNKWSLVYPFYATVHKEGVVLYGAAR